jgi:RHO1 GDP-GTP exchange protein 1/2
MAVMANFKKFIVHHETSLFSYSLDILARVAQGNSQSNTLDATGEKIAGQDGSVLFFKAGYIGNRSLSKHLW